MMTPTVVMGAGFGDEGKGLITDFEVRRLNASMVARFNGGAQAGHTVVSGDKRHVFGHLASGSFAGAKTYLGRKFIVNPILLAKERACVQDGGTATDVIAHPRARVSTIYDMVLNSIAEIARGRNRHGSCGMGINETVTRHEAGFELTVGDLASPGLVRHTFSRIKAEWIPRRLHELLKNNGNRSLIIAEYADVLNKNIDHHVNFLLARCEEINIYPSASNKSVVFEGAQGLRLDEFLGVFPHVTRSITGLPYAILTAEDLRIKQLKPIYVTRCYTTRHGAGELPYEGEVFMNGPIESDKTNVPNQWQGQLRYAPLDLVALKKFINSDIKRGQAVAQTHGIKLEKSALAITCLDQIGPTVRVISHDGPRVIDTTDLPEYISTQLGIQISHVSYGPEAKNVTCYI